MQDIQMKPQQVGYETKHIVKMHGDATLGNPDLGHRALVVGEFIFQVDGGCSTNAGTDR